MSAEDDRRPLINKHESSPFQEPTDVQKQGSDVDLWDETSGPSLSEELPWGTDQRRESQGDSLAMKIDDTDERVLVDLVQKLNDTANFVQERGNLTTASRTAKKGAGPPQERSVRSLTQPAVDDRHSTPRTPAFDQQLLNAGSDAPTTSTQRKTSEALAGRGTNLRQRGDALFNFVNGENGRRDAYQPCILRNTARNSDCDKERNLGHAVTFGSERGRSRSRSALTSERRAVMADSTPSVSFDRVTATERRRTRAYQKAPIYNDSELLRGFDNQNYDPGLNARRTADASLTPKQTIIDGQVNSDRQHTGYQTGRIHPDFQKFKLPGFDQLDVRPWLTMAETTFQVCGISTQQAKFYAVLSSLPREAVTRVFSAQGNGNMQTLGVYPFNWLRDRLIELYKLRRPQILQKLRNTKLSERYTATDLLHDLYRSLAGSEISKTLLRDLYLERLPSRIREILTVHDLPVDQLALKADALFLLQSKMKIMSQPPLGKYPLRPRPAQT